MTTLLVKNIGTLQTPSGSFSHRGRAQGENIKLKDAAVFIRDKVIEKIARGEDTGRTRYLSSSREQDIWIF